MPSTETLLTQILGALVDIRAALGDLISTTRFSRGGYDGPMLRSSRHIVGYEPVLIFSGAETPVALLIETDGTGEQKDCLYIHDDRGQCLSGYRFPLNKALSVATGNPIRIVADRHQRYYAMAVVKSRPQDKTAFAVTSQSEPNIIAATPGIQKNMGGLEIWVREGRL
jgi:hypothetical protein